MQRINFSKHIYEINVYKGCIHILKRMENKIAEDGCYEITTYKPVLPEIVALLLKMGFDLDIYLSKSEDVLNVLKIYCKKEDLEGSTNVSYGHCFSRANCEEYMEKVHQYKKSRECEDVLKRLERELG